MINDLIIKTKFAKQLNANSSNTISPLIEVEPFTKAGYRTVEAWYEIENLIATNYIQSLEAIPYPVFPLEASDSERDVALLNLQWKSARVHLNLYLDVEGQDRQLLETTSMLSPKPYPYAKVELGSYPLGKNSMLSVSIQNVGFGLLQGSDKIILHGDLISHILIEKISEGKSITNSISNAASLLLPENSNRTAFTIFNSSSAYIYIDVVDTVSLETYMVPIPPNTLYESTTTITSSIYAISDGLTPVSVQLREFT